MWFYRFDSIFSNYEMKVVFRMLKRIFVLLKLIIFELNKDIERGDNFDEMLGTYKGREHLKYSIKFR